MKKKMKTLFKTVLVGTLLISQLSQPLQASAAESGLPMERFTIADTETAVLSDKMDEYVTSEGTANYDHTDTNFIFNNEFDVTSDYRWGESVHNGRQYHNNVNTFWHFAIPIVMTSAENDGVVVNNIYEPFYNKLTAVKNEWNNYANSNLGDTSSNAFKNYAKAYDNELLETFMEYVDWDEMDILFNEYISISGANWEKSEMYDTARVLFNESEQNASLAYGMPTAIKEGHTLVCYVEQRKPYYEWGIYADTKWIPTYLEPIWVKDGTFCGTVLDVKEGDTISPGSLVFGVCDDLYAHYSNGRVRSRKPFIYTIVETENGEYLQIIGESATVTETAALSYQSTLSIARLADDYNGVPVKEWIVKNVTDASSFKEEIIISNDWGTTTVSEFVTITQAGNGYIDPYMIAVEPVFYDVAEDSSVMVTNYTVAVTSTLERLKSILA